MGRSKTTGVYSCSDGGYEVDAQYKRQRIRRRGFSSHDEAVEYLTAERERLRLLGAGVRPLITLDKAAARYVEDRAEMPSIETDVALLKPVIAALGSLTIDRIDDDALKPWVEARQEAGRKAKTINNALGVVRTMLNLAATKWKLENGLTWLAQAPTITALPLTDQRPPRPISWAEQRRLLPELPDHLAAMALFDLHTGLRENVVCNLRWAWEAKVRLSADLTVSVFVVPRRYVKGRKQERLVVCNSVAQSVIEAERGRHPEFVFTYSRAVKKPKHRPIQCMNNTAWQSARIRAGLDDLHVHDLRHTTGMRMRMAGIGERTQDDVLWHKSKGMTAHYATAQVREIYEALERIAHPGEEEESASLLALIRETQMQAQIPQNSPTQRKTA